MFTHVVAYVIADGLIVLLFLGEIMKVGKSLKFMASMVCVLHYLSTQKSNCKRKR